MIWHVEERRCCSLRDIGCWRIQDAARRGGISVVEEIARVYAERDVVTAIRPPAAKSARAPSRERPAGSATPSPATSASAAATASTARAARDGLSTRT